MNWEVFTLLLQIGIAEKLWSKPAMLCEFDDSGRVRDSSSSTRSVNVEIHVWWSATVMVYVQRIDKVTLIDDIQ